MDELDPRRLNRDLETASAEALNALIKVGDAISNLQAAALVCDFDISTPEGLEELMQNRPGLEAASLDMEIEPDLAVAAIRAYFNNKPA